HALAGVGLNQNLGGFCSGKVGYLSWTNRKKTLLFSPGLARAGGFFVLPRQSDVQSASAACA
ncbi:MAG: hypothetical protein ACMV1D_10585, partial [Macromonas sp.]